MRYRPEIDGLRAVAILAVVLYHAGVFGTNGGYVGVDVFFVISGYLITGIVAAEVNDGRFSLVSFYERRARRILPALFVVIIATTSFTQLFFIDSDLEGFARSVGATAIFSSNILFWLESNYFASPSLYKPLLHTWSLGIEEQFYIFFPLLLLVAHKLLRSGLGLLILALAVVSLAANIWATGQSPNAAFYLIQFRAWELFLGAIVAIGVLPRVAMRGAAEVLAVTGIGLIAASVFLFDDSTEFPGVAATAPCVGACLIIWSNSHIRTIVGSFLSHKLLVGIGLISYSLYLWHWPILALSSYLLARPLHSVESLIAIGASMLAAIVSWRFVEQPFRGRASKYDRAQIFLASSVCACTMLAFGITGHFWNGSIWAGSSRFPFRTTHHELTDRCFSGDGLERLASNQLCVLGVETAGPPRFLVWGDSHANALFPAFSMAAVESQTHGLFAGQTGCPPLIGLWRPDQESCRAFNDAVMKLILASDIETIFLVGRWNLALGRTSYELDLRQAQVFTQDDQSTELSVDENLRSYTRGLERTLGALSESGRKVWIVLQVPSPGVRVPIYLRFRQNELKDYRIAAEEAVRRHEKILAEFSETTSWYGVSVIDPVDLFCAGTECLIARDGRALYVDDDHVSPYGAGLLISDLVAALEDDN